MTTLKEKIESHWFSIGCVVVLATISATSAFLYSYAVDPRNILLSEKSYQISELEEKLRFAQGQDVTAALNALQIKYDTELANNTELRSALTKNDIRWRLFDEIQRLQVKERELKVLRYQVLVSIEKLIPQISALEHNSFAAVTINNGIREREAATARMTLEKEKNELSWLEKQIEQINKQIITIESRI